MFDKFPQAGSTAEFLGFNFEALAELIAFVDFSEGFTIAIAEINFAGDADRVMEAVRNHPRTQDVDLVDVVLDDPGLESVLDAVRARLEQLTIREGFKPVLVLRGLEQSIGITGDLSVKVLQNLNYTREQFRSQVPYPIVLVLPRFAVQRLAAGSRDFWAWASAIVRFQSAMGSVSQARSDCFESGRMYSSDRLPVKKERLDLLLRLLEEYRPLVSEDQLLNATARLEVLNELGNAFDSISDMRQASKYYEQFFALAQAVGDENAQANGLFKVGRLYYRLDDRHQDALENYDQALVLYQSSKNRLGEANTLKAIGDVLQFLAQRQDALNRYETAIEIYRQVGDRLGEANTLIAIGDVLQFLKQSQDALNRYETAIEIYRQVGARLGEANTLKAIGDLEEDPKNGLNRFNQAMQIYQEIGDQYSQARILATSLAPAYIKLNQSYQAKEVYQTALQYFEEIDLEAGIKLCKDKLRNLNQ